ncbi:MAG: purine-nucleoside phosphorylase [Acidobacteria bacterium CG_4_9_14_3_um_filter_49_7]|nr:MAG: purine-nucleoside phosphorylase [Acidobacteria bacterium CG_4_9_14_3_um_filter_49_7]
MIDDKRIMEKLNAEPCFRSPDIAVVLGSGLGSLADREENESISYSTIPAFPQPTVEGHGGKIVFAEFGSNNVMMFQGRFHFYEGYPMDVVTLFPRLAALLGARLYLVTNAAGGVNRAFHPGDLMVIRDHLNLMGVNPLIGRNRDELGPRFPDMTHAYDPEFSRKLVTCGKDAGLDLREGVYAALTGPSYETPAEINMLRTMGADAIGMSTVPEVIVARHAGLKVCGISCITNLAAGVTDQPLSHAEVLETGERVKYDFVKIISSFLESVSV